MKRSKTITPQLSTQPAVLHWYLHPLFHLLVIILIGTCAYSNTFQVPFIFDDTVITKNPLIENLDNFWSIEALSSSRYIGTLTFAINFALHGHNVWGYHLTNLLIHLLNAGLVYALVEQLLKTPFFLSSSPQPSVSRLDNFSALFAALIFVSHPLQTQAVTYIVQRYASLTTLFYLLTVVAYGRGRLRTGLSNWPSYGWYFLAIIAALCATKTKEIAFTLPFALFLYEGLFFGGNWQKRLLLVTPFIVIASLIPLTAFNSPQLIGVQLTNETVVAADNLQLTRWDYLCTELKVIVTYLRLLVLPINQQFDYNYPVAHSFWQTNVIASLLLLLTLFAIALWLLQRTAGSKNLIHREWRIVSFGILWFFLALSIESSVIPIADVIFEHRLYLPSVGFAIALPILIRQFWRNNGAIWSLGLIILILTGATYRRNLIWKDEETLWMDNLRKSPENARIYGNLADIYQSRREYSRALEAFNRMLELNPNFAVGYNNRGCLHNEIGRYELAIKDFRQALALAPSMTIAHVNLGNAYDYLNDPVKALAEYNFAIAQDPNLPDAYYDRGIFYRRQKMEAQARADLRRAEQLESLK